MSRVYSEHTLLLSPINWASHLPHGQRPMSADNIDLGELIDGLLDPAAPLDGTPDGEAVSLNPCGESSISRCWGAELKGDGGVGCTPGFESGKAHFKNKFCSKCRQCVEIPSQRARAMPEEMKPLFTNSLRQGFWKLAPASLGGGDVRIANNTITCDGPWLIVYRELPPDLPWEPMPEGWVDANTGCVRLSVAKGTLVPTSEMWRQRGNGGGGLGAGGGSSVDSAKRKRRVEKSASTGAAASGSAARDAFKPAMAHQGRSDPFPMGSCGSEPGSSAHGLGGTTSTGYGGVCGLTIATASSLGQALGSPRTPAASSTPEEFFRALANANAGVVQLLESVVVPGSPASHLLPLMGADEAKEVREQLRQMRIAVERAESLATARDDAIMGESNGGEPPPALGHGFQLSSSAESVSTAGNYSASSSVMVSPDVAEDDDDDTPADAPGPQSRKPVPHAFEQRMVSFRWSGGGAPTSSRESTRSQHDFPELSPSLEARRKGHFTEKMNRMGHSDSRLVSRPNRLQSLRNSLKKMFISSTSLRRDSRDLPRGSNAQATVDVRSAAMEQ